MTALATSDLFAGYWPTANVFDEMKAADGAVRPHWQPLAQSIGAARRATACASGARACAQLLREHGVTYNVHADGQSAERTWELDVAAAGHRRGGMGGTRSRPHPAHAAAESRAGRHLRPAAAAAATASCRPRCSTRIPASSAAATASARRAISSSRCTPSISPARRMAAGGCSATAPRRRAASATRWKIAAILSRILPDEFRECRCSGSAAFFDARKAGLRSLAPWTSAPHYRPAHVRPVHRDVFRARLPRALPRLSSSSKAAISPCATGASF